MGKHLSIRISKELYNQFVKKAIKESRNEGRLISVSEIIRNILEKNK